VNPRPPPPPNSQDDLQDPAISAINQRRSVFNPAADPGLTRLVMPSRPDRAAAQTGAAQDCSRMSEFAAGKPCCRAFPGHSLAGQKASVKHGTAALRDAAGPDRGPTRSFRLGRLGWQAKILNC